MKQEATVFAPATVANVACAFDVLGFALEGCGDMITARRSTDPGARISRILSPYGELPADAERNTASVAAQAMLSRLKCNFGCDLEIEKQMPVGSGLGSSAASAAGAVCAVNELLDRPLQRDELVEFAMEGERAAAGAAHADNVSPALLGGFTIVRQNNPLDVVRIPYPDTVRIAIVCPLIEVKTEDARKVLKKSIPLKTAVEQFGNIAGLVAGLCTGNIELMGRSLNDAIIEPERSILIPGYAKVKKAAYAAGALGCSISGSGPSLFALCAAEESAERAREAMAGIFRADGIESKSFTSPINSRGCVVVSSR